MKVCFIIIKRNEEVDKLIVSGFVGYKKNGVIEGFKNNFESDYRRLGLKVLSKFEIHSNEELQNFFINKLNFSLQIGGTHYFNQKLIWTENWLLNGVKIKPDNDFLFEDQCHFGYVYNLDDDTLDIYRGLFDHPQSKKEQEILKIKNIFIKPNKTFTHLVYSIKRDEIRKAEKMFVNWVTLKMVYKNIYPEKEFMKIKKEHFE